MGNKVILKVNAYEDDTFDLEIDFDSVEQIFSALNTSISVISTLAAEVKKGLLNSTGDESAAMGEYNMFISTIALSIIDSLINDEEVKKVNFDITKN